MVESQRRMRAYCAAFARAVAAGEVSVEETPPYGADCAGLDEEECWHDAPAAFEEEYS